VLLWGAFLFCLWVGWDIRKRWRRYAEERRADEEFLIRSRNYD
jgi:hypothetical protein